MNRMILGLCLWILGVSSVLAEPLPPTLVVPIMLKLVSLEDGLMDHEKLRVQVIGRADVHQEAMTRIGSEVGNGVLTDVVLSGELLHTPPHVIFAAKLDPEQLKKLHQYCQQHGVLLIGEQPELVSQGLALVLYNDEGVPGVLLNLSQSKKFKLRWHPDVLNVVSVYD